jgi:hypothetical protein
MREGDGSKAGSMELAALIGKPQVRSRAFLVHLLCLPFRGERRTLNGKEKIAVQENVRFP